MRYRCYFLNLRSEIAGVEIIEADNDAEAVARGAALFREHAAGYIGFEVWDRDRRVERGSDGPMQIWRWRRKAEEIRTAADGSARQALLNSAATYETLADSAEARLQRQKDAKPDVG